MKRAQVFIFLCLLFSGCRKENSIRDAGFDLNSVTVDGRLYNVNCHGVNIKPQLKLIFNAPLDHSSTDNALHLTDINSRTVQISVSYENHDSTIVFEPSMNLGYLSVYSINVSNFLKSKSGGSLVKPVSLQFTTAIDSTDKFPRISDDSLLTLVQKQTFRYFWELGSTTSGMALERNSSGETVTTGGTGFGLMTIPVAIGRKFITYEQGLTRVQTLVNFLTNKASRFHGAFPHWMNGASGAVIPFATNDDGADIVETSYLIMGLLTVRQYFNGNGSSETNLRATINDIWNSVEWDWFRKNGEEMLYWNWSPDHGWDVNVRIKGWNECLITYVLAASSSNHSVPKSVYDIGFADNGNIKNNNSYYGIVLPLGDPYGGPLFFEHYSFLGINPSSLMDTYADYHIQTVNHTFINYEYCVANPKNYFGYSKLCWGLTSSDTQGSYNASSPTNDIGVIAPTAAISSIPYTPAESLEALRFFYYKLGNKIWGNYGFVDAFNLTDLWFADSYLAIDQIPQIVMIENYRTGLVWNLFMSCPEVQTGLTKLGFSF